MLHVIVTGPESSGKSTLTRQLADALGAVALPEYPRGYLEAVGRRAVLADFDHFAAAIDRLLAAVERRGEHVVQDTGFEVLKVWSEDKFEVVPEAVERGWRQQRPDAYVLCAPDVPWEYDPLREDPHRRAELYRRYRTLLAQSGPPVIEVSGELGERLRAAVRAVRGIGAAGVV